MRGSIRKWLVVGTLASASLLFPACADTNQGADTGTQEQMGTGGAGSAGMEGQEGMGGSGTSGTEPHKKGTHGAKGGGTMAHDAGTPGPTDAGTGGAGMDVDDASGDVPTK
uniref:Lipoprotein n=1 Tax=Archangium violaceum TaxID=83451 RepID=A0A3Q8I3H7_9BACT|nr:hypothetical protein [Archangium violaceum]